MEILGENSNSSGKHIPVQEHHSGTHYQNHFVTSNMRRYPTISSLDPAQMQMYPASTQMYAAQNAPCYACLTVPVPGVQNRYSRYVRITQTLSFPRWITCTETQTTNRKLL